VRISLQPALRDFIQEQVKAGEFRSADEMIRFALLQLKSQHVPESRKLRELRSEIKEAADSLDRGEGRPFDAAAIKRAGRRILAQRRKRAR
jgi:putative addiction module CopG family antidote